MAASHLRFGPFVLQPEEHRLLRDGVEVSLQPAAFELLVFFARRPGRLLTREDLLREAWSVHVSDQSLSQMVRRVRVALGEDPDRPHWIETVRGRGYRFRGEVRPVDPSTARATGSAAQPAPAAGSPAAGSPAAGSPAAGSPAAGSSAAGSSAAGSPAPEASGFVGRSAELHDLRRALAAHRLVTVLGPGGVGKTRLARQLVATWGGEGAAWCELQAARDEAGVVHALWAGRGMGGGAGADPIGELAQVLGGELLVLDNVEQVLDAVRPVVQRLLDEAPRARLLLTSRVRLDLPVERCLDLGPLPEDDAVALLRDRAEAVRLGLGRIEPVVARAIVQRVGGLPLALVLAAPGLLLLSPAELRDRLADGGISLRAPGGGEDRDASLAASIRWSWDLLDPAARQAAARCAVFRGPFGLDAATAVLDLPDAAGALARLRDRSLLVEVQRGGARRLALLEPVRAWLEARLAEAGEREAARARHARHFAAAWDDEERSERLAPELEDLRAAVEHAPDARTRARVVPTFANAALERVGPVGLRAPLDAAVATAESAADWPLLAVLLCQRGWLQGVEQGLPDAAEVDLRRARTLAAESGATRVEARALAHLGVVLQYSGRRRDGVAVQAEAVAACRAAGWSFGLARALAGLGHGLWKLSEVDQARALLLEAVDLGEAAGAPRWRAFALCQLADIAWAQGDLAGCDLWVSRLRAQVEDSEDRKARRWLHEQASRVAMARGRHDEAVRHAQAALRTSAGAARCGALMRLVNARLAAGARAEVLPLLVEAELLARRTAQRDHLGWVLEVRCALDAALGEPEVALARGRELRALLDPDDPSDAVQVEAELYLYAVLAGHEPGPPPDAPGLDLREPARRVLALAHRASARAAPGPPPGSAGDAVPRPGEPPFVGLLRAALGEPVA